MAQRDGSDRDRSALKASTTVAAPDKDESCCVCLEPLETSRLPVKLSCRHWLHYNCALGVANRLCPLCRTPIPRSLRQGLELDADPFEGQEPPLWEYEARGPGSLTWQYEPEHSREIEVVYQRVLVIRAAGRVPSQAESTLALVIRGQQYVVDVVAMQQRSPSGATRAVRRREPGSDPERVKGVAGATPKRPTPKRE
jgi:hypothetical protein